MLLFPLQKLSSSIFDQPHLVPISSISTEISGVETNSTQVPSLDNASLPQIFPITDELHSPHIMTRSQTGNLRPKEFPGFKMFYSTKHPLKAFAAAITTLPLKPTTYHASSII